ncbi:alpha/beta hydrolase [Nocardia stercoris]|nr:alpha/beta hydrolase family protein [Nocardia stercoris]
MLAGWFAAAPQVAAATVVGRSDQSPTRSILTVDSPAMGQPVQVEVLHPAGDGPRPSYYLLDGLDAGTAESGWTYYTDAEPFFAGKNVNVVMPLGGEAGYYTDWTTDSAKFGRYQWETFLTQELPPLIDSTFAGNGVNGVGGLSMGGIAAYVLAARHPDLYRAVAGYSACPEMSMVAPVMQFSIVNRGGNPDDMWGPIGSPEWAAHDPAALADNLRGKALFLSAGTGIPGLNSTAVHPEPLDHLVYGSPIETGVDLCSAAFGTLLQARGIPITVVHNATGLHSWAYWQQGLHDSWPMLAGALGA